MERKNEKGLTVSYWNTRTLKEEVVKYGYISQPLETPETAILFDGEPRAVYDPLEGDKPLISVYEINDTSNGIKSLLRKYALPEINRLDLYRIGHDDDDNLIKLTVKVRIGSAYAEIQRNLWAYHYDSRTHLRLGTHTETVTPTLTNLKLNKKFDYSITFRCGLCTNYRTLDIKNHGRTRKTPHCKTHDQPMFILKIRRRHKNTVKRNYRKWSTVYYLPLKENEGA